MAGRPAGPPVREGHGVVVLADGVRAAGGVAGNAWNGCCGGGRPMGFRRCGGAASDIVAGGAARRTGSAFALLQEPSCRMLLASVYRSVLPMVTLTERNPSPIFCEIATSLSKVAHAR